MNSRDSKIFLVTGIVVLGVLMGLAVVGVLGGVGFFMTA
jgi:hypothetical protein